MSSTIDDFRNFFKSDKKIEIFNINKTINEMISITDISLNKNNININVLHDKKYLIKGYKSEFGQAILNILNNAKDALIQNNIINKKITIKIYDINNNVHIDISDNAGGIEENIIKNIFDPYFSTKKEKNGTGLGLYMSKLIIEEHMNGSIKVTNKDNGAIFSIILQKDLDEEIK
jgi:signal transduction histidine kinase